MVIFLKKNFLYYQKHFHLQEIFRSNADNLSCGAEMSRMPSKQDHTHRSFSFSPEHNRTDAKHGGSAHLSRDRVEGAQTPQKKNPFVKKCVFYIGKSFPAKKLSICASSAASPLPQKDVPCDEHPFFAKISTFFIF